MSLITTSVKEKQLLHSLLLYLLIEQIIKKLYFNLLLHNSYDIKII